MVIDERSEHEPDEPEFDVPEGEDLVPPTPGGGEDAAPEAPSVPDETDAPPEVVKTFWVVVLLVNVALASLTIGPVVLVVTGYTTVGLALLAIGALTLSSAVYRYRSFVADPPEEWGESEDEDEDENEGEDGTPEGRGSDRPADDADSPTGPEPGTDGPEPIGTDDQ